MAQEFSKAFYNSRSWLDCRDGYIKSVQGLCEKCREKGKATPGYIVHHREVLNEDNINDPAVALNWDKLMYLCLDCHNAIHGHTEVLRDDVMFDEFGMLVKR